MDDAHKTHCIMFRINIILVPLNFNDHAHAHEFEYIKIIVILNNLTILNRTREYSSSYPYTIGTFILKRLFLIDRI